MTVFMGTRNISAVGREGLLPSPDNYEKYKLQAHPMLSILGEDMGLDRLHVSKGTAAA